MNNREKDFIYNISKELEPHQSYDDSIFNTFKKIRKDSKLKKNNFKLTFATASCSILLVTGVVFAKDIENFVKKQFSDFNVGNGVTTAIENGYVGKSTESLYEQNTNIIENHEIIDNINVKSKVEEFLMTDSNINISFYFEFENKINDYVDLGKTINNYIDYEGSHNIVLSDLVIIDENKNVLYYDYYKTADFKEFCRKYNINYNNEQNEFAYSSSVKEFINYDNSLGANFVYNISSSSIYPQSKELNIYFSKIDLIPAYPDNKDSKQITLEGNWEIHLEVPEIMYNRKSFSYKVIGCDDNNFEVYTNKLTDTNFEIGVNIKNVEEPIYPVELIKREKELSNIYTDEEMNDRKKI